MKTNTIKYQEVKETLTRLNKLINAKSNLRNVTLYVNGESLEFDCISEKDCKPETEINRITFQVFDENTKRNSTVYIYFKKRGIDFECSNTFMQGYKINEKKEKINPMRATRKFITTTDFNYTMFNLLKLHGIKEETKTATTKKKTATKKTATVKKEA